MTHISEAVDDLFLEIRTNGFSNAMLDEFAGNYEINPVMLLRKFVEKYGEPNQIKKKSSNAFIRAKFN